MYIPTVRYYCIPLFALCTPLRCVYIITDDNRVTILRVYTIIRREGLQNRSAFYSSSHNTLVTSRRQKPRMHSVFRTISRCTRVDNSIVYISNNTSAKVMDRAILFVRQSSLYGVFAHFKSNLFQNGNSKRWLTLWTSPRVSYFFEFDKSLYS